MNAPTPDMEVLKTRLKATWQSGDYGKFATYLLPGAMTFSRSASRSGRGSGCWTSRAVPARSRCPRRAPGRK